MSGRLIVIGVDRSPETSSALDWVATEARPGDAVQVVHAYSLLPPSAPDPALTTRLNRARREDSQRVVDAAVRFLRDRTAGVTVSGSTLTGAPVPVLIGLSKIADLIVIGGVCAAEAYQHGPGQRIGRWVATIAACPVVVVPGAHHPSGFTAPVAVLFTGTDVPIEAVEFGFAAAARRRTSVLVTHSWALGETNEPRTRAEILPWEIEEQKGIDQALAGLQARYPEVPVVVALRRVGRYLVSRQLHLTAQLLVIGRDVRDPAQLSSLTTVALTLPVCPVAIVPAAYSDPSVLDTVGAISPVQATP